jgi:hypothetical protein
LRFPSLKAFGMSVVPSEFDPQADVSSASTRVLMRPLLGSSAAEQVHC